MNSNNNDEKFLKLYGFLNTINIYSINRYARGYVGQIKGDSVRNLYTSGTVKAPEYVRGVSRLRQEGELRSLIAY